MIREQYGWNDTICRTWIDLATSCQAIRVCELPRAVNIKVILIIKLSLRLIEERKVTATEDKISYAVKPHFPCYILSFRQQYVIVIIRKNSNIRKQKYNGAQHFSDERQGTYFHKKSTGEYNIPTLI